MQTSPHHAWFRLIRATTFFYLLLLVYGTLYPITNWQWPTSLQFHAFSFNWPTSYSKSDVLVNLIIYVPFGFLLSWLLQHRFPYTILIPAITLVGASLSLSLEFLQSFIPSRVSSISDIALNSTGMLIGTVAACLLRPQGTIITKASNLYRRYFHNDPLAELGLLILIFWALTQLMPLVPAFDLGSIKNSIKPLWLTFKEPSLFGFWKAGTYTLNILALFLIGSMIIKKQEQTIAFIGLFIVAVLTVKIFITTRQLSSEALAGLSIGLSLFVLVRKMQLPAAPVALVAITIAFLLNALHFDPYGRTHILSWILLQGQMVKISGLIIVETIWPFMALSYLTIRLAPTQATRILWIGSPLVALAVFYTEWIQQFLPGRYPDITDVYLSVAGWLTPPLLLHVLFSSKARNML